MIPFGGGGIVQRVTRLVLTWYEALSCPVRIGLTLTSTCLGLGLMYLVMMRSSRCTPSVWTGNV
jgi:hypothetical protein